MDGIAIQCGMARQATGSGDPLTDLLAYVSAEGLTSNFAIYDLRDLPSSTVTPSGGLTTNTMSLIGSPLLKVGGVTFNGSTQYGVIADFLGSDTLTIFARNNISTTSPGAGTRAIVTQYDGFTDRTFYFGYNYGTGLGTRLFRSSDGTPTNQEAYENGVNTLPGSDITAVAQWIDGGGRSIWHDKTAQSLSLFAGSAQTSQFDTSVDILVNAVNPSAPINHLPTTTVAVVFLIGTVTTAQRETITDFINAL